MMHRIATAALLAVLAAACSRQPAAAPTPATDAERLEAILETPIDFRQDSLYTRMEADLGADIEPLLAALAVDSTAHPLARANAVLRMGARPMLAWQVYRRTIEDPDPRVRGATLGVAGPFISRLPGEALPIIGRGLVDPDLAIQAKALQELRDRDLDLLRFYLSTNPPPELRDVALQTMYMAQSFGAPLIPERDGTLRRMTPGGVELVLRPDSAVAEWDYVIGTLSATPVGGTPRVIADTVEAVLTIIPAVVDPTGRWVALETNRRLEIHDLETGEVRQIGPGISPRPLPLTPDFFFFREIRRNDPSPMLAQITYELVRMPFDGGPGIPFDTVTLESKQEMRGWLSPARWARVHDRVRRFVVDTDGMRNRPLPTPFSPAFSE